jgi:crotonobetaine/carnitine-CoA ligase
MSLDVLLETRATTTPDAPFVTFGGERMSYADAAQRAARAAAALASLNVRAGSKVALMMPNCLEFLDLWFGAAWLGAVLVPVNAGLRGEGLRYIIEHSNAEVLVVDSALTDTVDAAFGSATRPTSLVRGEGRPGYAELAEVVAGEHPDPVRATNRPEDLTSILYTSGTTGLPKGVMNCHNAYLTAGHEFVDASVRVRPDDVLYTSLPLFHINAQSLTTIGSLVSGRPMILAPRFSASRMFDEMRRHRATIFNYIGAMLTMLFKQPVRDDDADNPARMAIGGAAPAQLWRDFERRFALEILEIYGLTETACFCLSNPPDEIRPGKIGTPVTWAEVRIESPDGDELPRGEAGEICIRSKRPATMLLGYYKNDAATQEAMRGGWFHSGDRGSQDEDGYFAFIDRIKDSIRRRGENISSYEIERVVNEHPDVQESAAIGVPSDLGEDEVMVVVVPRSDGLSPEGLVAYCEERLAAFMVPRYVKAMPALPKTATERVRKFQLRESGTEGAWDRLAPSSTEGRLR